MPAGPPCFGKKAEACAADPTRESQYKYIPTEICEKFDLPPGACVCKSKLCWRVFGMADDRKPPGRPSAAVKRAREDSLTPVLNVSVSSRSKPTVIVKIHSFKDARRAPARSLCEVSRLSCALTIAGRFFHRCSVVDFERPSSDESVVEARRDPPACRTCPDARICSPWKVSDPRGRRSLPRHSMVFAQRAQGRRMQQGQPSRRSPRL